MSLYLIIPLASLTRTDLWRREKNWRSGLLKATWLICQSFKDSSFDFIVHPISNCFIPNIRPVWKEAFRVLRPGGTLISGFCNPIRDSFDWDLFDQGIYQVRYPVPYSDLTSLTEEERIKRFELNEPLEFGHSLEDQIGGQLDAGFHLIGFYEDVWEFEKISEYMPLFIATRALKP